MDKKAGRREPEHGVVPSGGQYLSADERRAEGKALRDAVPRGVHGGWKPPKDRRDPIELLLESNEGRVLELIPIRFGRMAQSPFALHRKALVDICSWVHARKFFDLVKITCSPPNTNCDLLSHLPSILPHHGDSLHIAKLTMAPGGPHLAPPRIPRGWEEQGPGRPLPMAQSAQ